MNKIIEKIIRFILGFFKIRYNVKLKDKPIKNLNVAMINKVSSTSFAEKIQSLDDKHLSNVRYSIDSYNVKKVSNDFISDEIAKKKQSANYIKANIHHFGENAYEIKVTNTIFNIGIDDKLWRFQFKSHMFFNCPNDIFINDAIEFISEMVNIVIKSLNLDKMCRTPFKETVNLKQINCKMYSSTIKTFGDYSDVSMIGINELIPSIDEDNESVYLNLLHEFMITDLETNINKSLFYYNESVNNTPINKPKVKIDVRRLEAFDEKYINTLTVGDILDYYDGNYVDINELNKASSVDLISHYRSTGNYYSNFEELHEGDMIFFKNDKGSIVHHGIVTELDGTCITIDDESSLQTYDFYYIAKHIVGFAHI